MGTVCPADDVPYAERLAVFAAGMRACFGIRARAVAARQAEGARAGDLPSSEAWLSILRMLDGEARSA